MFYSLIFFLTSFALSLKILNHIQLNKIFKKLFTRVTNYIGFADLTGSVNQKYFFESDVKCSSITDSIFRNNI